MKDINSSLGGGTYPAPDDTAGTIKGITVRNRGVYGRRVGIFTNEPGLEVGAKLHAADYRHVPGVPDSLPDGYQAGATVELAGARNYHTIFTFQASAPFQVHANKRRYKNARMGSAVTEGLLAAVAYDPETAVNDFPLGDMSVNRNLVARNFVSFTLNIAGVNSQFVLDVNKHPALLTADFNHQLANVNHNLRGYVSVEVNGEFPLEQSANWKIHLAVPTIVSVKVPRTNYNVETFPEASALTVTGLAKFQATHLNNALLKGLDLTRTTKTEYDMTPIADADYATALTVSQLIADMSIWTEVYPSTPEWSIMHILQPSDFHVLKQDTRYKVALIEISPSYINGDLHQLKSVNYVKGGVRTPAELLVVGRSNLNGIYGSRLIDVEESLSQNRLVGLSGELISVDSDVDQYLPEKGSVNGGGDTARIYASRIAVAVIAPANVFNHYTPLYRTPTENVTVELNFTRDQVVKPGFFLVDDAYEWDKENDSRVPVAINLAAIPNTVIEKAIAAHSSGTIEELSPVVVESEGEWQVQFQDGFSQRSLTFGQTSGSIDFTLELKRTSVNGSAATNLRWQERKDYSVILPTVYGQMELQSVPQFVVDAENNDLVVFQGTLNLPEGAPVGTRNPLYYCSDVDFTANVNGQEAAVVSGVFAEPNNYGQDAPGLFSFTIAKSALSDFGPGLHTLNVSASLDLLWNDVATINGSVQFRILPLIEGTEDDVTFFTPEIYGADTSLALDTSFKVMDLDTGEVLAESTTLQGLKTDAETRGLVDVSMIYGNPLTSSAPPSEIQCTGATDTVSLEMSGNWLLEVDGIDQGGPYTLEQLRDIAVAHDIEITLPTNQTISCAGAVTSATFDVGLYRSESGGGLRIYDATTDQLLASTDGYFYDTFNQQQMGVLLIDQMPVDPNNSFRHLIEVDDTSTTVVTDSPYQVNAKLTLNNLDQTDRRLRIVLVAGDTSITDGTTLLNIAVENQNVTVNKVSESATEVVYELCLAAAPPLVYADYFQSYSYSESEALTVGFRDTVDWTGPLKSTIESIDSGTKLLTTTDKLKVDIPSYTELMFRDSDQIVVGWHPSDSLSVPYGAAIDSNGDYSQPIVFTHDPIVSEDIGPAYAVSLDGNFLTAIHSVDEAHRAIVLLKRVDRLNYAEVSRTVIPEALIVDHAANNPFISTDNSHVVVQMNAKLFFFLVNVDGTLTYLYSTDAYGGSNTFAWMTGNRYLTFERTGLDVTVKLYESQATSSVLITSEFIGEYNPQLFDVSKAGFVTISLPNVTMLTNSIGVIHVNPLTGEYLGLTKYDSGNPVADTWLTPTQNSSRIFVVDYTEKPTRYPVVEAENL